MTDLLLRDLFGFVVLVTACFGRTVVWRGKRFHVQKDGTLILLEGSS
jgi:ceramide glucosyltransferase